jgi:hypothetical protein
VLRVPARLRSGPGSGSEAPPRARVAQVGRRAHALLLAHMQRYSYSATGALRWKRDITEYADVLRTAHSPPIAALARAPRACP